VKIYIRLVVAILFGELSLLAQMASPPASPNAKLPFYNIQRLSRSAIVGDQSSRSALFDEIGGAVGISREDVAALRIKARVLEAEQNVDKGSQLRVPDENVARTVNDIVIRLKLPNFCRTNVREVRLLRSRLHVQAPGITSLDRTGNIAPSMRPLEAVLVTAVLIRQKVYNPDFQKVEDNLQPGQYAVSVSGQSCRRKTPPATDRSRDVLDSLPRASVDWVSLANAALEQLGIHGGNR
jgi:hypothetical protein